jgi:hypothetical protein
MLTGIYGLVGLVGLVSRRNQFFLLSRLDQLFFTKITKKLKILKTQKLEVSKMGIIENFNCDGLCSEKYCSNKYTHFAEKEINGLKILIFLCEKHYEKFLEGRLKNE